MLKTNYGTASVIGTMIFLPRIRTGLELTDQPEVIRKWNSDMTERMEILLPFSEDSKGIRLVEVRFNDSILQNLYKQATIQKETGLLERDKETGDPIIPEDGDKLKIVFKKIPHKTLKSVVDANEGSFKGTLSWRKGYRGKVNTKPFSFNIDKNPYPVNISDPIFSSQEIKEGETCTVSVNVTISMTMPSESKPLELRVYPNDQNIVELDNTSVQLEIKEGISEDIPDEIPLEFTLEGVRKGKTVLKFEVVAKDNIVWREKTSKNIKIKERDRVYMSNVELINEEDENQKPEQNGNEIKMYFSNNNQKYYHKLRFFINEKGSNVIILIYSNLNYSNKMEWLEKPNELKIEDWQGKFKGENKYGHLIIISKLDGKKEFEIKFENPISTKAEEEILGIALIKIKSEGEFCNTIIEKTEERPSSYKIINNTVESDCYEYYAEEFTIKYIEKEEADDDNEPITTLRPIGLPKNIFSIYLSFFIFLFSYLSLRRGGIL